MTAHLVMRWTYQVGDLIQRHPEAQTVWSGAQGDRRTREAGQRRSLLLFRFAPPIFLGVWVIVLICSLVQRS